MADNNKPETALLRGEHQSLMGDGLDKDFDQALYWWTIAASNGHYKSQNSLSLHLFFIGNTEEDKIRALMWSGLAASNGNAEAKVNVWKIRAELNSEQIARALRLAEECEGRLLIFVSD